LTYQDTIQWMFQQLPMFQRQGKVAFKKDLTNTIALAKFLNNPEKKFKSIHVGGTNGKGSTSHMLAAVLQESGYKVGLYTSPHLKDFRERIKVNGKMISKNCVINFIKRNKTFLEQNHLSFFEMTVGLAFEHFAKQKVDIAIVEVGLGGRLDSTNIIQPELSIITNIAKDHTQMLGNTFAEIAFEKAGIIKANTPAIIGEVFPETKAVFDAKATKENALIYYVNQNKKSLYKTDLLGDYQLKNLNTVVFALDLLKDKFRNINDTAIKNGLLNVVENTGLYGRWQILADEPLIICDTAHNEAGLKGIINQINKQKYKDLHLVLGFVNDKNVIDILKLFPKDAHFYLCKPNIPRGMELDELEKIALKLKLNYTKYTSVSKALQLAQKKAVKNDFVFVGGSTFVVAEVV